MRLLKFRRDAEGVPPSAPSRAELWRRHRLALSVLDHRGTTAETSVLVQRILSGEPIETLTKEVS